MHPPPPTTIFQSLELAKPPRKHLILGSLVQKKPLVVGVVGVVGDLELQEGPLSPGVIHDVQGALRLLPHLGLVGVVGVVGSIRGHRAALAVWFTLLD